MIGCLSLGVRHTVKCYSSVRIESLPLLLVTLHVRFLIAQQLALTVKVQVWPHYLRLTKNRLCLLICPKRQHLLLFINFILSTPFFFFFFFFFIWVSTVRGHSTEISKRKSSWNHHYVLLMTTTGGRLFRRLVWVYGEEMDTCGSIIINCSF